MKKLWTKKCQKILDKKLLKEFWTKDSQKIEKKTNSQKILKKKMS